MSAYVVDRDTIRYLVSAAMSPRILGQSYHSLRYQWGDHPFDLGCGDFEAAAHIGQVLWNENQRSVNARYGDSDPAPEYGQHVEWFGTFDPVQVLKTISCLNYQSCETKDWENTQAAAFLRGLERQCIGALAGYESAAWGAPKEQKRAEPGGKEPVAGRIYSISEMMKGKPIGDCEVPR